MTVTADLVEWAISTKYEALSSGDIHHLKQAVRDSIACMVGGYHTEVGQAIQHFVAKSNQPGRAIIPGSELTVSPRDGAFINAILANALDYDDTYEDQGKALCHPGSTLMATALAVSSLYPTPGKEFLTALAVGYEVSARVGESIQPSPETYVKVWGLNHFMVFGAVVVAARLLQLDLDTALNAFGIAGVAANVPSAWKWNWDNRQLPLSWQKDMVSWPAEAGLRAAFLAESGFRGCLDILDGEDGFWRMSASDRFDPTCITQDLGQITRLKNLAFKPYPCCRWMHSILEAFQQALDESRLDPHEISTIEVNTLSELANHFNLVKPRFMIDAEFSVPYTIAMVARRIPVGPAWHTTEVRNDEETHRVASKVRMSASSDLDQKYFIDRRIAARVRIITEDGRTWEAECSQARGGAERPFPQVEHDRKVRALLDLALRNEGKEWFDAFTTGLENSADVHSDLERVFNK